MLDERFLRARKKSVGSKQTTKAVRNGVARCVYVARDAESHVTEQLLKLCQEKGIQVITVDSMLELGRACGIEVGSASAAIVED